MSSAIEFARRESRKRRRPSERRRAFTRIGTNERRLLSTSGDSLSTTSWSTGSSAQHQINQSAMEDQQQQLLFANRSDSPLADNSRISMKIQFHITVAPENEPLLIHDNPTVSNNSTEPQSIGDQRKKSTTESIGEQIHERLLSRQNTASTRRRQQLVAMHNQSAVDRARTEAATYIRHSDDNLALRTGSFTSRNESNTDNNNNNGNIEQPLGREHGARSSTITGGIMDEATSKFLAKQQLRPIMPPATTTERELIYFKRDGQRFGHEFTLKLAVERTYRCLLKVRPLIPLQAISIQGSQVLFVDCSHGATMQTRSAPASSAQLANRSWSSVNQHQQQTNRVNNNHRLSHAQTSLSRHELAARQSQMMRHFTHSQSPHLGGQLVYMFDWSASRQEATKNKARVQLQSVLKFKNGQLLTLPLQVKFYPPECKQHLNWGSQLHFVDYDCSINNLGQISVDRIQYY